MPKQTCELDFTSLLTIRRLPAQLYAQEAAALLRISVDDLNSLAAHKYLKPLGKPKPNAPKLYSSVQILQKCEESDWLDKINAFLASKRREKNKKYLQQKSREETPQN